MVEKISAHGGLNPVMKRKTLHREYAFMQPAGTTDEVNFSPFAKELGRIMGELERVPEVRQDKISNFKKQIEEGIYMPDPANVARSLLVAGFLSGEE